MKHCLFLFIMLLGCSHTAPPPPLPQAPGPRFSDRLGSVEWTCEETDVNDSLVWVRCEFYNELPPIAEVCIQVVYNDKWDVHEVASSHTMCTGPLWAGGKVEEYAAFFKNSRVTLAKSCGPRLDKCYMRTKVVPRP